MKEINKSNQAIENITIILFFIPIAIILMVIKIISEYRKQKLIFAFAGNMESKNEDEIDNIFINDSLTIVNNNKPYLLGSKFIPVRISGDSMKQKEILDQNIAIFDCESKKSSYDKGDVVLIKMPSSDKNNANQYKLRLFNRIENNKVLTNKYASDSKDIDDIVASSKLHHEKYLIGKFKFLLNDQQQEYVYKKYSV